MKNYAEVIQGVNNKCMAVEDEACGAVDGFSKPNAEIMNEIKAECSGKVTQICVKNGDPVEFGQVLMYVE